MYSTTLKLLMGLKITSLSSAYIAKSSTLANPQSTSPPKLSRFTLISITVSLMNLKAPRISVEVEVKPSSWMNPPMLFFSALY